MFYTVLEAYLERLIIQYLNIERVIVVHIWTFVSHFSNASVVKRSRPRIPIIKQFLDWTVSNHLWPITYIIDIKVCCVCVLLGKHNLRFVAWPLCSVALKCSRLQRNLKTEVFNEVWKSGSYDRSPLIFNLILNSVFYFVH